MHNLSQAPCSSITILIAIFSLVASLGHAAEPFTPARVAVYFSRMVALRRL